MGEIYAFLFCLGLGITARLLFIATNALAKKTGLIPVTVMLDIAFTLTVGACFTIYVGLTGTPLAPYMFAALGGGYFLTYKLTPVRSSRDQ